MAASLRLASQRAPKNNLRPEFGLNGTGGRYVNEVYTFEPHEKVPGPVSGRNWPYLGTGSGPGQPARLGPNHGTFLQHTQSPAAKGHLHRSTGTTFVLERATPGVLWPALFPLAVHSSHTSPPTFKSPRALAGSSGKFSAFSSRGDKFENR